MLWHAHNTFLNVAFQTGIQGLVIFCFLIYKLIRVLYNGAQAAKFPKQRYFLQATFMMTVAFFARNLFDDFFIDDSAMLFWFLIGLAITQRKD
jgi:O-antigen ligase